LALCATSKTELGRTGLRNGVTPGIRTKSLKGRCPSAWGGRTNSHEVVSWRGARDAPARVFLKGPGRGKKGEKGKRTQGERGLSFVAGGTGRVELVLFQYSPHRCEGKKKRLYAVAAAYQPGGNFLDAEDRLQPAERVGKEMHAGYGHAGRRRGD